MRTGLYNSASLLSLSCASLIHFCDVDAAPSVSSKIVTRADGSFNDPAFLPAQIGGIAGSYAFSLVLVALALLALSKRRREHLQSGEEIENGDEAEFVEPTFSFPPTEQQEIAYPYPLAGQKGHIRNFSLPSPTSPSRGAPYIFPSPTSTTNHAPGVDLSVDQDIVAADRQMAQNQLEEMYKLVMEQEAAKEAGVKFEPPQMANQQQQPRAAATASIASTSTLTKNKKNKPMSLNLNKDEKKESRASSILSSIMSPRKKKMQGLNISSPIMTPMSGTFPPQESEEMANIPPRHYAPAAPPPVPRDQLPYSQARRPHNAPLTPDMSPQSTQSIDERIGAQFDRAAAAPQHQQGHYRNMSTATTEADPISAVSDSSSTPLIGLPSSPKPGQTRFSSSQTSLPSLPSSPKPGSSFSRPNAPTAIRTGGALPLRAYEPAVTSPSAASWQTKQTTFERTGPLSPSGQRTPFTGTAVPYSPYQPFSPCVPITPSLVTKADRKRMKRLEPKTPTLEMVKSHDEVW